MKVSWESLKLWVKLWRELVHGNDANEDLTYILFALLAF